MKIAHRFFPYIAAGLLWLLGIWAFQGEIMQQMESNVLDWHLRAWSKTHTPDPDIVIIDIDEYSLAKMAPNHGRFPWSRSTYATILNGIKRQKSKAIVFDLLVIDLHKKHQGDDRHFIRSVRHTPNAYLAMLHLEAKVNERNKKKFLIRRLKNAKKIRDDAKYNARAALLLPLSGIWQTGRIGLINAEPDKDGTLRQTPLYMDIQGWRIPSLPYQLALDFGFYQPTKPRHHIAWHGGVFSYQYIPFYDIFSDLKSKKRKRPQNEFRDKIVIIGTSAAGLHDLHPTPMGAEYPGVEVLATTIDNLKNGNAVRHLPAYWPFLILGLLLSVIVLATWWQWEPLRTAMALLVISALLVLLTRWLILQDLLFLPIFTVLLFAWLFFFIQMARGFIIERHRRHYVTAMFGRFLDPRVVKQLANEDSQQDNTEGKKQQVTILFSDIRGFTTLSEQKPAQEIVELLNNYFSLQVETIFHYQGTLDKYMGDAIMAFWGAPTPQPDHVYRALCAARDMERNLFAFQKSMGKEGENFDIGIGIHTGEAIVGFIGSPQHRQDYTVIGDTVNIASRIEGITRGHSRILVSEACYQACKDQIQFIDQGKVSLKGKTQIIGIYQPLWD